MPVDGPAYRSSVDNYDLSSINGIEADIAAMEEFAAGLKADLVDNYMPHADAAVEAMFATLPSGGGFYNLHLFLYAHQQAQDATQQNVDGYIDGTYRFATSAEAISAQYRGSDAFSRAKVSDVEAAFKDPGVAADTTYHPGEV
ncbi:hypothetical protein [Actinoplanes derwentensis]|uniref:Uncharacterized protein n=1 Tax=Actinoplanes derwentensis TaxID=113562 RepID=A0A1H2D1P2_9ACTN|nr:hypothetical protein [Actinoplanes derwentensis]GID90000.1 hypothetical protein Ade03nite_89240 [Actinoplanes derwentensis]SDT76479.1 hypothetical protein SAMN04489716_7634 [Actinoplanes derwentensis]